MDVPRLATTRLEGEDADVSHVCVAVRCRPLLGSGWTQEDATLDFLEPTKLVLKHDGQDHLYTFDYVFDPLASQDEIFQIVGEPSLENAFKGYDCTIFAYGQTGTGKTYTMLNHDAEQEELGLTPRISRKLFESMEELKQLHETRHFLVQCSFLQIYNEVIHDLLLPPGSEDKSRGLEIREQKGIGIYVKDLTEVVVDEAAKLNVLLTQGLENRATAATRRNRTSSRSHCIITIKIHIRDERDITANTVSKIILVDLAGSENAAGTELQQAGSKEAANINKSLCALGNVINALSSSTGSSKSAFVPYRDSKLTRILQESLGGHLFCTMVATVSAAPDVVNETMSTLRYARRTKAIRQEAKRYDEADQVIHLRQEVAKLKEKLELETNSGSTEEHLRTVEERYQSQIEVLESAMRQSWEEKQQLSEQREGEMKEAKQRAEQAAEEQQRRLALLEQHGKLELTMDAVASADPGFSGDWSERLSCAVGFSQKLASQLRAVSLYRDSVGTDFASFWKLRRYRGRCGIGSEDVITGTTLLHQIHAKLMAMIKEMDPLIGLVARFQELMCLAAPEVAVACRKAREANKKELLQLLALLEGQLSRHYFDELSRLHEEVAQMNLGSDLATLAKSLMEKNADESGSSSSSEEDIEHEFHDADPNRLSPAQLQAMLDTSAYGAMAMMPDKSACQLPRPVGFSTGQFSDDHITASSNPQEARSARLWGISAYGGWSPTSNSSEEYLEVDLAMVAQGTAVVGLSLQGRTPCSGHWLQTQALLNLTLTSEQNVRMNAHAMTFMRPPVRLVHEIAMALACRECVADPPLFIVPASVETQNKSMCLSQKPFAEMSRGEKVAFFDDLIQQINAFGTESLQLTSQDILAGKNCQETNKLLQLLARRFLRLSHPQHTGGHDCIQPQWTTAWKLRYLSQDREWRWFKDSKERYTEDATVFTGNVDASSVKLVILSHPLHTSKIRVHPVTWHVHPAFRLEIHTAENVDSRQSYVPSVSATALKAAAELAAAATMQCLQDLRQRQTKEANLINQERSQLEQRLSVALRRIQMLETRLAEMESSLLAAQAENERLKVSSHGDGGVGAVEETTLVPLGTIGSAGFWPSASAGPGAAELEAIVEELREQLAVVTDERDAALMHEKDLFYFRAEMAEELKRAQENYMNLVRRLQRRNLELFNTLEIIDADWVLSDLDTSEELLYEGFFIELAGCQHRVAVDDPRIRNFILRHTGVGKGDINVELLNHSTQSGGFWIDQAAFLRLLRETPVSESALLQRYIEATDGRLEGMRSNDCRRRLLDVLKHPLVSMHGGREDSAHIERLLGGRDQFEHIMDVVMAGADLNVSLEKWLAYCRRGARVTRVLYFARCRDLILG